MKLALEFIAYIGSWGAACSAAYSLFEKSEIVIKDETRSSIARWLQNSKITTDHTNWPKDFAEIFDRIFGYKHFTLRCFLRSCLASIVAVFILCLMAAAHDWRKFAWQWGPNFGSAALAIFFASAICNLIPDYLALLETRLVLRWMSRTSSSLAHVGYLLVDIIIIGLTSVLGIFLFALFMRAELGGLATRQFSIEDVFDLYRGFGIWFYASFFTSVWLWLFALSSLLAKLLNSTGKLFDKVKNVLDFEKKPLQCLGWIVVMLITCIFILIPTMWLIL
jgi:hypothetical protein